MRDGQLCGVESCDQLALYLCDWCGDPVCMAHVVMLDVGNDQDGLEEAVCPTCDQGDSDTAIA